MKDIYIYMIAIYTYKKAIYIYKKGLLYLYDSFLQL